MAKNRVFLFFIFIVISGSSMASSLMLPSASSLKGDWIFVDGNKKHSVTLTETPDRDANGFQLYFNADIANPAITSWRPEPDGIALISSDGTTQIFFSREDATHFRAQIWRDGGPILIKE